MGLARRATAQAGVPLLLQRNVLDSHRWASPEQLGLAVVTWIERNYHRRRQQRRLGKLRAIDHEMLYNKIAS